MESLVKSNECDERSRKYDLQKNLKNLMVYPKEEKSQGETRKLFKYAKSRRKEVRNKSFIGLTYFCFKCSNIISVKEILICP